MRTEENSKNIRRLPQKSYGQLQLKDTILLEKCRTKTIKSLEGHPTTNPILCNSLEVFRESLKKLI